MTRDELATGVIGIGSMGRHHARVYRELPETTLVGVADADTEAAEEVASTYETEAMSTDELLDTADAVSIAVPTRFHYDIARDAIDEYDTNVLIEKPFVESPDSGRRLIERAREKGLKLQVGHIERFNPAVRALTDIVPDLDVIAVEARRLGPPIDRELEASTVLDLMIHDIDVLLALIGDDPEVVEAVSAADDRYVTATMSVDDVLATLTASRVTQRKVRELSITARTCQVHVDYISRSVQIHRHSIPEYIEENGDIRYRHENIVEHPTVDNGEPLKKELSSFAEAILEDEEPTVTGEDGLRALELAREIEDEAIEKPQVPQQR